MLVTFDTRVDHFFCEVRLPWLLEGWVTLDFVSSQHATSVLLMGSVDMFVLGLHSWLQATSTSQPPVSFGISTSSSFDSAAWCCVPGRAGTW